MKPISQDTLNVLRTLKYTQHPTHTQVDITQGQLPPNIYQEFKTILKSLGGKWNKKTHVFPEDPQYHIQTIIEIGRLPDFNPYDFYPTPPDIVEAILTLNEIQNQSPCIHSILEPSCGTGAFLKGIKKHLPDAKITAVEINPLNVKTCQKAGFTVQQADFLTWDSKEKFDLIVMNPPFQRATWQKHYQHALKFLNRYGIIACITPTNLPKDTHRQVCHDGYVYKNKAKAFSEAGTLVDTYVLVCQNDPQPRQKTNGFPSRDAYNFALHTDNDEKINERLATLCKSFTTPPSNENIKTFKTEIDRINDQLLQDYDVGFILNDEDHHHLLQHQLADIEIQTAWEQQRIQETINHITQHNETQTNQNSKNEHANKKTGQLEFEILLTHA
jgi:predicted RNA methylase